MQNNILGTAPISKLIIKFAVPSVISLLVNSLYNIVDQIFIGRGVGYLGNGATNVIFPVAVIMMAFSLLIGDGATAYMSLTLGEGDKEKPGKGVSNAITLRIAYLFNIAMSGIYAHSTFSEDNMSLSDKVYVLQSKIIRDIADKGPCVIESAPANQKDSVVNQLVAELREMRVKEVELVKYLFYSL